jgi:hypothetical protein
MSKSLNESSKLKSDLEASSIFVCSKSFSSESCSRKALISLSSSSNLRGENVLVGEAENVGLEEAAEKAVFDGEDPWVDRQAEAPKLFDGLAYYFLGGLMANR